MPLLSTVCHSLTLFMFECIPACAGNLDLSTGKPVFFSAWQTHTWQMRKAQGPPGTNFPSLFRRPVHYREQGGTILRSPPTSFAAIFPHSLPLSPPETQRAARLPTVHHCAPVKPRLVAAGSPRFQSCRHCLECFLSPSIFHLSCFWEWK